MPSGVCGQQRQHRDLQQRRRVRLTHEQRGDRRPRHEHAALVDGVVCWVEAAVLAEGGLVWWEEERWRDDLVDGIFGDVQDQEWYHAWYE